MERNFDIIHYKKSSWIVIDKSTGYVLSQGIYNFPFIIYEPIEWSKLEQCERWCNFGFISEIQEDFGNLNVKFTNCLIELFQKDK